MYFKIPRKNRVYTLIYILRYILGVCHLILDIAYFSSFSIITIQITIFQAAKYR